MEHKKIFHGLPIDVLILTIEKCFSVITYMDLW